jgi:hypothetical protein
MALTSLLVAPKGQPVGTPDHLADFDSATAMVRATAASLRQKGFPDLGQSRLLEPPTRLANLLPWSIRRRIFIASGWLESRPPDELDKVDADDIARWVVGSYPQRPYPAMAIGSSNGAAVHLYAALGIPWLPQSFLLPVRQSVHPDDALAARDLGRRPGHSLVANNPDIQLHHMHDANQDRLMVRTMTYFRIKRRVLGRVYRRFIEQWLPPGGTLLVLDCQLDWAVNTVGERHYFQHGAYGGATEEEFHHGSPRVEKYLAAHDSPWRRWEGPPVDTRMPEAEWGFETSLLEDLRQLAAERHYRLRRISLPGPAELSPLVADLYRWWYRRLGIPTNRLVVSSFIMMEPWWTLRSGSIPFWMVFNTEQSADALEAYLNATGPYDDVLLMLFSNGVADAVGATTGDDWRRLLRHARRHGAPAGVDLDAFPGDFASFARYHDAIKGLSARLLSPPRLELAEFDLFLRAHGDAYDVTIEDESDAP